MENKSNVILDIYRMGVMWSATVADALFGSVDGLFVTLLIFMTVDYITGVCAAVVNKQLSSRIGAKGLVKKFGILCIVSIAALIEKNIIDTAALRDVVILYYISNEGISILENSSRIGIPIPQKLREVLKHIPENDEENKQ